MGNAQNIIEVRKISKKSNQQTVLSEVSFDVASEAVLGIVSESAVEIKELSQILSGNSEFESGDLFVDGLNVIESRQKIKNITNLISDEFGLDERLTIRENVCVYATINGLKIKQANADFEKMMREFLLEGLQDIYPGELTSEQHLWVLFVRAQITKPKALIIDLSGEKLNEIKLHQLSEFVKIAQNEKQSVVVLSKKINRLESFSNNILILKDGIVVSHGEASDLLRNQIGSRVAVTSVNADDIEYYLKKIRDKYHYQVLNNKIRIFLKENVEDSDLIEMLNSDHIEIRKPNLHDVYCYVTGVEHEV